MSFRSKGLVLAMEDDAPVVQVEINAENEVPAEVEADVAELTEKAGDVEDLVTAVEEAEQDAATLDRMAGVMEESADKGEGLDETAAEIAEVAVEAICNRLGIRTHGRAMPALESFGSRGSRVSATRISVEGIKEWITTTWEAIKKAFKDMWNRIKEFFAKFFEANERLKNAATQMKANLSVGDTPKETAFQDKSIGSQFLMLDSLDAAKTLEVIKFHAGFSQSALDGVVAFDTSLTKINKVVETSLKVTGDARKSEVSKVQDAVEEFIKEQVNDATGGFNSKAPDGSTIKVEAGDIISDMFIGGNVVVVRRTISDDQAKTKSFGGASVVNAASPQALKMAETMTLKTLKKSEMESVLAEIIKMCEINTKLKTKSSAIGNIEKKFDSAVDSALNAAKNLDSESKVNESVKEVLTAAKNGISGIGKITGVITTAAPKLSVQAGKAALAYVSKSIAQYKK